MENGNVDQEKLQQIKHDIKNQLSSITLALEALRYEIPEPSEDYTFCIHTITTSTLEIDSLLNQLD